nr:MAG TPA: hypothetical protein [Caudoviricetes sp.]
MRIWNATNSFLLLITELVLCYEICLDLVL